MLCLEENMWFCMNQRYQAKYYYVVCPSRLQLVPLKDKLAAKQRFIKARLPKDAKHEALKIGSAAFDANADHVTSSARHIRR